MPPRLKTAFAVLFLLSCSITTLAQEKSTVNYDAKLERAIDFYSQKKYSEAAALLVPLTQAYPDRKEAFLWLGQARAELNDWSAAREAYKRYSELAPTDVEGPRGVGRSYEMEGKKDLARFWYKKALDLEPNNENLKQALARLGNESPSPVSAPPQPATTATESAQAAEPEPTGFWRTGIAGAIGVRKIWWARVITIVIFGMMVIQGAFMTSKNMLDRFPRMPVAVLVFNSILGTAFWYILVWGLPAGLNWLLLALCVLVAATLCAGAAANR